MKEVERFIAEEVNGRRHTVSCLQEIRKNVSETSLPEVKHYKTASGALLKAIDDSTFHILGTDKVLYKNTTLRSLKFNSRDR